MDQSSSLPMQMSSALKLEAFRAAQISSALQQRSSSRGGGSTLTHIASTSRKYLEGILTREMEEESSRCLRAWVLRYSAILFLTSWVCQLMSWCSFSFSSLSYFLSLCAFLLSCWAKRASFLNCSSALLYLGISTSQRCQKRASKRMTSVSMSAWWKKQILAFWIMVTMSMWNWSRWAYSPRKMRQTMEKMSSGWWMTSRQSVHFRKISSGRWMKKCDTAYLRISSISRNPMNTPFGIFLRISRYDSSNIWLPWFSSSAQLFSRVVGSPSLYCTWCFSRQGQRMKPSPSYLNLSAFMVRSSRTAFLGVRQVRSAGCGSGSVERREVSWWAVEERRRRSNWSSSIIMSQCGQAVK